MTATLKVDTIKEVNSSVDNLVLDSSGNVTIGNNLTVTGTTTQTGSTTFTSQTLFPDGSVSAPSISNTGDVNTGVYFPAADNVAIATGGVAALTIDSSQNVAINSATFSPTSPSAGGNFALTGTVAMGSSFKRNRIINGDMQVFQRGTAATASNLYSVDRWQLIKSNDATESVSQNTDAPTGFSYSLRNTISVADASIGSFQFSGIQQTIEGYNIADFGFGAAGAKSITISFWVRSSVIGQYTGNIRNGTTQVCPFNFNIVVADTWEYKAITLPGSVTGSWNTTNGAGIYFTVYSALGSGYSGGTAGVWGADPNYGCGTPVNGLNTNGNIFAITGVQLEAGSIATPYERQIYSDQLAQCHRYYYRITSPNFYTYFGNGRSINATYGDVIIYVPVPMRITPVLGYSSLTHFQCNFAGTLTVFSIGGSQSGLPTNGYLHSVGPGSATSGLVQMIQFNTGSASAYAEWSAEL